MIIFVTGARGSGKSTLAKELCQKMGAINIDGDMVRRVWTDLKFSDEDRFENNMRVARLAKEMEEQGFDVIVSTICPDIKNLRQEVFYICKCKFIHL